MPGIELWAVPVIASYTYGIVGLTWLACRIIMAYGWRLLRQLDEVQE